MHCNFEWLWTIHFTILVNEDFRIQDVILEMNDFVLFWNFILFIIQCGIILSIKHHSFFTHSLVSVFKYTRKYAISGLFPILLNFLSGFFFPPPQIQFMEKKNQSNPDRVLDNPVTSHLHNRKKLRFSILAPLLAPGVVCKIYTVSTHETRHPVSKEPDIWN